MRRESFCPGPCGHWVPFPSAPNLLTLGTGPQGGGVLAPVLYPHCHMPCFLLPPFSARAGPHAQGTVLLHPGLPLIPFWVFRSESSGPCLCHSSAVLSCLGSWFIAPPPLLCDRLSRALPPVPALPAHHSGSTLRLCPASSLSLPAPFSRCHLRLPPGLNVIAVCNSQGFWQPLHASSKLLLTFKST